MTGDTSLEAQAPLERGALEQEASLEPPGSEELLCGELRRLPPSAPLRVLQALTLLTLFRALAHATFRYTLNYRHQFVLHQKGRMLILERERLILGRCFRRSRTLLPLQQLEEVTLERAGEPAAFTVGLAALAGGTFVGTRFISEGILAPGFAPWLLGGGSLLIFSGVLLDFFVGSGRTPARISGSPELSLRVSNERGWVLARFDSVRAEELLHAIEHSLTARAQ